MKTIPISLVQLLRKPTREDHLIDTVDRLEDFFRETSPPIDEDPAPMLFDTMDDLVSGLSMIYDTEFSQWSCFHRINNKWDLRCQCSRIKRWQNYEIMLFRYDEDKPDSDPVAYIPVKSWIEMLPEKH